MVHAKSNPDEALTVQEVVALLGINKSTVYDLIKSGKLKGYTVGLKNGAFRVDRSEVTRYKKKNRVKP